MNPHRIGIPSDFRILNLVVRTFTTIERTESLMKRTIALMMFIVFIVSASAAQSGAPKSTATKKKAAGTKTMTTQKEKMSYVIGYDIGRNISNDFQQRGFDVDNAVLLEAMKHALAGQPSTLTDDETKAVTEVFQQQMLEKQAMASEAVRKEGMEFLAANAKKDSVKVTASGLQYKTLREGNGKRPADTNTVTVHYRGRLIDGTVFDESYKRGEPATFRLNQVIKGWTEGLQLMSEGGKMELYIPSELGYGDRGAGQHIKPGSALIFEVELISVQ